MEAPPTPRTTAAIVNGKFRRNGKLQSCEPCRKSKLRCDHVIPACGRCVQKGRVDQCVYHPHPLTGTKPARQAQHHARRTPSRSAIPTPTSSSAASGTDSTEHDASAQVSLGACQVEPGPPSPAPSTRAASAPASADTPRNSTGAGAGSRQAAHGFLGATSYSSIFSEGLGNLDEMSSAASPGPVDTTASYSTSHNPTSLSPERLAQSRRVLSLLRDRVLVDELIGHWFCMWRGTDGIMLEPIMREWLRSLWAHHGDVLAKQEQDPEGIDRLVRLLWANTQVPVRYTADTSATEWARLGSGPGLRWEVVGIISGLMGSTAVSPLSGQMPVELKSLNSKTARDALLVRVMEASKFSLDFCRECGVYDDMFVGLVINHSTLVVDVKGIMSQAGYRSTAEAVDAVVSLGWHTGVKADDRTPFWLTEVRKRIVVEVYAWEIGTASVYGRPPRVSHRYWTLNPPLDLTDAQVVLQGDQLEAALAELDDEGYSTSGTAARLTRATYIRTRVWFSPRREDILDLALGNYSREEVLVRAQLIQERTERGFANMPPFARHVRDGTVDISNVRPVEVIFLIAVIQGIHVNEMMLQRVLIRKTGATSDCLINTARKILKDILQVTQRHDIQASFQLEITSILSSNGLRAAGILAVELLKQEQLPTYPEKPLLPRSQTIQDLAVFAARLGTVEHNQGFFSVCSQGRKYLTLILDKLLSPKPAPSASSAQVWEAAVPALERQTTNREPDDAAARHHQLDVSAFPPSSYAFPLSGSSGMPHSMNVFSLGPMGPPVLPGQGFDINTAGLGDAANDGSFIEWLENMDWERTEGWTGL